MRKKATFIQRPLPGFEANIPPVSNRGVKQGNLPVSTATKKCTNKYEQLTSTQSRLPIRETSRLLYHDIEGAMWGEKEGCMVYLVNKQWLTRIQCENAVALDIVELDREGIKPDEAKKRSAEIVKIKVLYLRDRQANQ